MSYAIFETKVPRGRGLVADLGRMLQQAGAGVSSIKRDDGNDQRIAIRANNRPVVEQVLEQPRFVRARL